MNRSSKLASFALFSLFSSPVAFAFEAPLLEQITRLKPDFDSAQRCTTDQLPDDPAALARIEWAHGCGFVDKEAWDEEYKTRRDLATRKRVPRSKLAYPIFVYNDTSDPQNPYPIWIPNHATCERPPNVVFFGICEAGCYKGSQRIAFDKGYAPIKEAFEKKMSRLLTLAPESTLEKPVYKVNKVGQYISSIKEGHETIRTIETLSGGKLEVTLNHPLVNSRGMIQEASSFRVGDHLVRADGSKDPIVRIADVPYFGKVYNVAPQSKDPVENIILAEGFLNGSQNYQSGDIKDINRMVFRTIPAADLLP